MRVTTLYIEMNEEDSRDPVYTDSFRALPTLAQLDYMRDFVWYMEQEYLRLLEVWRAEMAEARKDGEKFRLREIKKWNT